MVTIWVSFPTLDTYGWAMPVHAFTTPAGFIRALKYSAENNLPFTIRVMGK